MFHHAALLGAHGVSRDFAIQLISLGAGVGIVSTLVFGYLTDRLPAQKLLALSMLLLALDTLLLIYLPTPRMAILYSIIMGLSGGIIRTAGQVTWINYYGRKNQGAVCGAALSVMVVASGVGPYPLAWSEKQTGSFNLGLWIFLVLPIVSAICVWTAHKPTKTSPASIS
jgi:MFS family permease